MTLKGDKSCTTENCMLRVTGPTWTGSTMSPKEVVNDPLNPYKIRLGFSRPMRLCPMWLTTDACTRSAELPGSTRMRLTSKSPISRDMMRASRCGCNIRVGFTGGKMIVPSMGRGPPPLPPSYPRPDGVDTLTHRCCPQQPLSLSFGAILLVEWASVNIVYNGFGGGWGFQSCDFEKRLYLWHLSGGIASNALPL